MNNIKIEVKKLLPTKRRGLRIKRTHENLTDIF